MKKTRAPKKLPLKIDKSKLEKKIAPVKGAMDTPNTDLGG
jgi:hypothetical protein